MSEKTLIKGKDRDLESSIAFMQGQLASLGFDIEQVSWLKGCIQFIFAIKTAMLYLPMAKVTLKNPV